MMKVKNNLSLAKYTKLKGCALVISPLDQKKTGIKITLISPYDVIHAIGMRGISAYLKQAGHKVNLVFLTPNIELSFKSDNIISTNLYEESIVNSLVEICKSSDLIGFSLMTNHFIKVRDLTLKLKEKLDIPIIWGGIHPTVKPEECLEYADMVCVGDGEEAMLELANKLLENKEIRNIKNIWFINGVSVRNEVRLLEEDLDKYPFQDYDISTHYILNGDKIIKMNEALLEEAMQKIQRDVEYHLMTVRGCPHNCTYCCNNALRKIYDGKGNFIRKRSIRNVVEELELIKNRFKFIQRIMIEDDTFLVRSKEEIQLFCDLYKEKINLPLRIFASPQTLNKEKLGLLINAGLDRVGFGIQSFSQDTLMNIYKRQTSKELIIDCVKMLDEYKTELSDTVYDVIADNPYETKESLKETIMFVASLPEEFKGLVFYLTFFPGTELYERAKKDGFIKNEIEDVYLKRFLCPKDVKRKRYLNYLLHWACAKKLKKRIIKLLLRDEMIFLFDNNIFLGLIPFCQSIKRKINLLTKHITEKTK